MTGAATTKVRKLRCQVRELRCQGRKPSRPGSSSWLTACAVLVCASLGGACSSPGAGASGGGSAGLVSVGGTAAGGSGGLAIEVPLGGADGSGGACEREVSLVPVTFGGPQPFDLVIVADHSESLAWSQEELAAGLDDLLTHVQGRTVRVFLLTPTQYGESSSQARDPRTGEQFVSFAHLDTGIPYSPAATSYTQVCTDEAGLSIPCAELDGDKVGRLQGSWDFVMPPPIAHMTPELSAQEFAAEKTAVAQAILELQGTGSPQEQPLCTLNRYVAQAREALPDNAVFLVISDEDDASAPSDCLAEFETSWVRTTVSEIESCESDCEAYTYSGLGPKVRERFRPVCMAFEDTGEPIAGTERTLDLSLDPSSEECVPRSCSDEEIAELEPNCEVGHAVASCEVLCITYQEHGCGLALEGEGPIDACTQAFSYAGETYANLEAYCQQEEGLLSLTTCTRREGFNRVEKVEVRNEQSHPQQLVAGSSTQALSQAFRAQADERFGADHYLVEGILLSPEFSCELGPGQSHATNLIDMIGDSTYVFPLCGSYAPALDGVLTFAQALVQTEFLIDLNRYEDISGVILTDNAGSERTLSEAQFDFDFEAQLLSLDPLSIQSNDTNLRVEVTAYCEPVVR